MEGLLHIETGPKKGLFSLKSKKKFHAVLSGTTMVYTREGETTATGSIVFTTDTTVEGSPKGKRLISIKNKNGDWDVICPDAVTYGKWMDALALVFRSLHVDPEKFTKMVNAAEESGEDSLNASSSSHAPPSPHSDTSKALDTPGSTNDPSDSESTSLLESSGERKSRPNLPEKPERPMVPARPALASTTSGDFVTKAESRPDMLSKPPKPDIPSRAPSNLLMKTPTPSGTPPKTPLNINPSPSTSPGPSSPHTSTMSGEGDRSVSPGPSPLSNSQGSAPGSIKRGPRPSLPTSVPNIKNLQALSSVSAANASTPTSPHSGSASLTPTSTRTPLSARTQSVGTSNTQALPSPKGGAISPRGPPPPMPAIPASAAPQTSNSVDMSKKFIVWMPNGLKHGSIYNADFTVRSYLEKICRTRESVTPDTFIAKGADGKHLDLDIPLARIPGGPIHEIWWDTLSPGRSMPSEFSVLPSPSTGNLTARDLSSSSPAKPTYAAPKSTAAIVPQSAPSIPETNPDGTPLNHRSKIVREIQSTEKSYVESLGKLQEGFILPLLMFVDPDSFKDKVSGLDTPSSAALAPADTSVVPKSMKMALTTNLGFPSPAVIRSIPPKNFEAILGFNRLFCSELADCKEDAIGELFKKYSNFLKIYNDYSSDYQASLGIYNKAIRDFPAFAAKLDELRAATGSKLRIEDYIIMPVQRVPRYSLLIADLLKHTTPDHPDYAQLQEVGAKLSDIGNFINESVRKSDGAKRLKELEDKGVAVDRLITPHRFLVREGHVKVIEQKKKENKHFFLFNDIFVQVKDSAMTKGVDLSLPEYVWPLNLIWITETELAAEIVGPNGVSMSIKKKKADLTWIRDLNARILACIQRADATVTILGPRRVGAYTSPSDEQYDGEWLDGLKHGVGKAVLAGSVYEGSWENGKRSGKGSLTYFNGLRYVGDWKADLQHGMGVLSASDTEAVYSGAWANGSPNGQGTMTYYPSGDTYVGDFYSGRCTGQGTLTYANGGGRYFGQWLDDQFDGRGNLTAPDGSAYEGQFRHGVKAGRGNIQYADGSKYDGDWLDGWRQGVGEFVDVDGTTYTGDWVDDRAEGKGIKKWTDKAYYDGQFAKGLRRGLGKMFYPDGARYDGNWLDDVPSGIGTYIGSDGSTYVGEWAGGRREGKGVQTYASLAKYDGTWYNDRYHKSGLYQGASSDLIKSYEGEWLFGRLNNKGALHFHNGDSFRGVFKDGRAHGAGTYSYASGATFNGKWTTGLREGKGTYSPSEKLALAGQFELTPNVLATATLPIFLPPQQPLFLIPPAIDGIRLHRR